MYKFVYTYFEENEILYSIMYFFFFFYISICFLLIYIFFIYFSWRFTYYLVISIAGIKILSNVSIFLIRIERLNTIALFRKLLNIYCRYSLKK